MPLHLIKLCVGCDSVDDLKDWIKEQLAKKKRSGEPGKRFHRTRMVPKRVDELLDGGSLFWVIRGELLCRERILGIEPFRDKDGIGRCRIVLDGKVKLVPRMTVRAGRIVHDPSGLSMVEWEKARPQYFTTPALGSSPKAKADDYPRE